MGTKIQSKGCLSGYSSIWGSNESVKNDVLSLYHDGKGLKNYQHYDPVLPQKLMVGGQQQLGYDMEKVRQMILEHESTFRHQLQELHRLYGRQREIMNEFKRKDKNGQMEPETSHSNSFLPPVSSDDTKPTWHMSHTSLLHSLLNRASGIQNSSSIPSFRQEKTTQAPLPLRVQGSPKICKPTNSNSKLFWNRIIDLEIPADVHMNDEGQELEKRFSELPRIESIFKNNISDVLHNKEINNDPNGNALRSNLCSERNSQLVDLNEPVPSEENSVLAIVGHSSTVASTLADTGREQLGTDITATIMSNGAHPRIVDACSKASGAELRRDEFSISDQGMTKPKMKRKLFGVDIFEVDDKQLRTDPPMANCNLTSNKKAKDLLPKNTGQEALPKFFEASACLNWKSAKISETSTKLGNVIRDVVPVHNIVNADCQSEQNDSKGSLFSCIGTEHYSERAIKNKDSHHLNLDSLQHFCPQFFQKSRSTSFSSQIWVQKQEMGAAHMVHEIEQGNVAVNWYHKAELTTRFPVSNPKEQSVTGMSSKEIYSFDRNKLENVLVEKAISKDEPKAGDLDLEESIKNDLSGSRQHIDLNLSLSEDEAPSAASLPPTIIKIARTEIDLEAPMILQSESDTETNLPPDELDHEELLKIAAEAIVAISSSSPRDTLNVATAEPLEAAVDDHLSWFAALACCYQCVDSSTAADSNVDAIVTEEMIPEGMDYFEFMTLRLKDTKEDSYHCSSRLTENENEADEENKVPTLSRSRPRRGQARKGRQRKDFQRDILPGLVTLSKHEVFKDFQTLEELFKSSGCEWQSRLVRKTAGRRWRRRAPSPEVTTPPEETTDAICASLEKQEMQVEEKTLSGWGKRIRRLPRQRYMNGIHDKLKPS